MMGARNQRKLSWEGIKVSREGTDVLERKGWEGAKHEDGLKRGRLFFFLLHG